MELNLKDFCGKCKKLGLKTVATIDSSKYTYYLGAKLSYAICTSTLIFDHIKSKRNTVFKLFIFTDCLSIVTRKPPITYLTSFSIRI